MDAKQVAYGILDGISTIPSGMYHGVVRTWQGLDWLVVASRLETKKKQNVSPVWLSRWVTVKNPYDA